jgi:hypothetical protein
MRNRMIFIFKTIVKNYFSAGICYVGSGKMKFAESADEGRLQKSLAYVAKGS